MLNIKRMEQEDSETRLIWAKALIVKLTHGQPRLRELQAASLCNLEHLSDFYDCLSVLNHFAAENEANLY